MGKTTLWSLGDAKHDFSYCSLVLNRSPSPHPLHLVQPYLTFQPKHQPQGAVGGSRGSHAPPRPTPKDFLYSPTTLVCD